MDGPADVCDIRQRRFLYYTAFPISLWPNLHLWAVAISRRRKVLSSRRGGGVNHIPVGVIHDRHSPDIRLALTTRALTSLSQVGCSSRRVPFISSI